MTPRSVAKASPRLGGTRHQQGPASLSTARSVEETRDASSAFGHPSIGWTLRSSLRLGALLLFVVCASACQTQDRKYPEGDVPLELTEIVASVTRNALRTPLRQDQGFRPQLASFVEATPTDLSLNDLKCRWLALGPPAANIDLQVAIFDNAREDGSWDDEALARDMDPEDVPEAVDVEGFLQGARQALGR